MERNLNRMGISTVGQLAKFPLELLEKKFGIMGNQLYYHAHGIDLSEIGAQLMQGQISFDKSQILLRDYTQGEKRLRLFFWKFVRKSQEGHVHIIKLVERSALELVTVKMSLVVDFIDPKQLIFPQISRWIFISVA